jgi:cytochrome c oxidase accessory protein FixG
MEGEIKLNIRAERLAKSQASLNEEEDYRDTIATVDEKGKRIWIYPKKPSGKLHNWRIAVTVILLALLFGGPFIKVGGQPLLLLNVFERRFVFFGQAFWPQDFVVLAIMLITFFVFIILFTVVFGRVWCGWMCPQTLFMEMVFRKIEYAIEGDAPSQRRLSKEPWTPSKIGKKTLKHTIFLVISILIGHTVMAYLIGIDETFAIVTNAPSENLAGFFGLTAFTLIIYGVYAKFREQACIAVCPYGRLQSVLLTKESIVVAYDWLRGEPRRPIRKNTAEMVPAGDCIDCKLCVHVCPTGIDIRNGTQLECVNCTACIDACDDVMIKVGRPKGLIRFASFKSIEEGVQKIFTGKVIGYTVVLLLLVSVLGFTLISRSDVETTVLKVPGTLYQRDKNDITNLYNIEFVNKTFRDLNLEVKVESPAHATLVNVDRKPVVVPAEDMIKQVWFIRMPADQITTARTIVMLGIYEDGRLLETVKVKFIGPVSK